MPFYVVWWKYCLTKPYSTSVLTQEGEVNQLNNSHFCFHYYFCERTSGPFWELMAGPAALCLLLLLLFPLSSSQSTLQSEQIQQAPAAAAPPPQIRDLLRKEETTHLNAKRTCEKCWWVILISSVCVLSVLTAQHVVKVELVMNRVNVWKLPLILAFLRPFEWQACCCFFPLVWTAKWTGEVLLIGWLLIETANELEPRVATKWLGELQHRLRARRTVWLLQAECLSVCSLLVFPDVCECVLSQTLKSYI